MSELNQSRIPFSNKPTLTHQETMKLIDEYQATKDEAIKEKLIIDNTRLVLSMTKRFHQRNNSIEDLIQVGMIGLIKAIDNFNTAYELRFSTYAVPLILGEMKRYIRENTPIKISRSIKDVAYKALKIHDEYIQNYQRSPTIKEISEVLQLEEKVVKEAMLSTNTVSSLQEEVGQDDGNSILLDHIQSNPNDLEIHQALDLKKAIHTLNAKERLVIDQRYFQGHSQLEIAKELFISQGQVSRIEKQALERLHKLLK